MAHPLEPYGRTWDVCTNCETEARMELLRLRMPRNLHTVLPTVVEFLLVDRQHLRRLYFLLCALTSRRRGDSPFMRLIYWPPVHCVASWSPPSPLHRIMEFLV